MIKVKHLTKDYKVVDGFVPSTAAGTEESVNTFIQQIGLVKSSLRTLDLIYKMPKAIVTRDHMNLAKDKLRCKITRKIDAADKIILSKKYLESLFTEEEYPHRSYYLANTDDFIETLDEHINDYEKLFDNQKLYRWNKPLSKEHLITLRNAVENFCNSNDKVLVYAALLQGVTSGESFERKSTFISDDNYSVLLNLWKKRNKVFTERSFIDYVMVNNKADLNSYKSIDRMLNSNDKENHELAVTTLSGLSWTNNKDLLMLLLHMHVDKIKYTKAFSSVNFKSFKHAMYSSHTVGAILRTCLGDNCLTPEGLKEILIYHAKMSSNSYQFAQGDMFSLDPAGIKLPKEYDEIRSQLQFN